MSDNVAAENPGVEFVKPCNLCPHMKRISLENIYDALQDMKHEVDGAGGRPRPREGRDRRDAGPAQAARSSRSSGSARAAVPVELI